MTTLTTPATPAEVIDRMEQRLSMPHPASDTPPIAFEAAAETKFMPAWETDVLVIGAGPAGIAAATAAAQQGRAVLLLDDNAAAGGQIWREGPGGTHHPQGKHAGSRAKRQALQALHASGARIEVGSRVFDQGPGDNLSAGGSQRRAGDQGLASSVYVWRDDAPPGEQCIQVRYRSVIIATGARERFLPFPGWTLPGVYGAGGLQALVKGGYSVAGRRVIVAGSGPLLMAVAAHLRQDGARLVSIAEQASLGQMLPFLASLALHPGKIMQALRYRLATAGSPYRTGCWPVAALGDDELRAVRLTNGSRTWEEPCDLLAYGFHLVPNTEVAALLGCRFSGAFVAVDRAQQTSQPGVYCAGEPTGIAGLEAALLQGRLAGLAAANSVGSARRLRRRSAAARTFGERLDKAFQLRPELATLAAEDTIVCRCEDVRYGQLRSHHSWTEAKLQTRCGMGPCQGRVCGPAVETLFGWKPSSIRPPLTPVPAAALCSLRSGSAPSTNQSLVP